MISNNKLYVYFEFSRNNHKRDTIDNFAKLYEKRINEVIDHCTSSDSGGYTPSDFSTAGLNQQELDNLLANLN